MTRIVTRIVILLCLFQLPLRGVFSGFSYFDELLAAGLFVCFVMKTGKKTKIEREDLFICGCLFLLIVHGLFCNLISGVSRPTAAIAQDLFTIPKVFICYLGAKYLFCEDGNCWDTLGWAARVTGIIVVAGIACLFLSHLGLLDMLSNQKRMGVYSFEFIYDSPGMLSQYCAMFCVILTADLSRGCADFGRCRWVIWFLSLGLWASTLRTRAFVMILLMLFLVFIAFRPGALDKFQGHAILKRLTSPLVFVPVAGASFFVSLSQIDYYFGELESARSYLLDGGLRAFWEYFPFGAGFGTYGTEAARVYYSPLYSRYGLNSHWALGVDGSELNDTFWPAIIAELGLIGTVLYVAIVFVVLRRIVKTCGAHRFLLTAAVSFVAYVLVASTATGVFFSYTTSCCMFFVGLIMGCAATVSRDASSN